MSCSYYKFWDNGYIHGYYCDFTGNECDHEGFQSFCCAYEEDECESDDEE